MTARGEIMQMKGGGGWSEKGKQGRLLDVVSAKY